MITSNIVHCNSPKKFIEHTGNAKDYPVDAKRLNYSVSEIVEF